MSFSVIFLGTSEFSLPYLKKLSEDPSFSVLGVLTKKDLRKKPEPNCVFRWAKKEGIPLLETSDANDEETLNWVKEKKPDFFMVVSFGQILKKPFLDICKNKIFNVHASLLPRWRGAAPIQRSLMAGDKQIGVSLQIIKQKVDEGPLLGFRKMALDLKMGCEEVHDLLKETGLKLLEKELLDYLKGNLKPQLQDDSLMSLAPKIDKKEAHIVWKDSAMDIHNLIRALNRGPEAFDFFRGKKVKFLQSWPQEQEGFPGEILQVEKDFFTVACGQGSVKITKVHPESRSVMSGGDFVRGYRVKKGDGFGG